MYWMLYCLAGKHFRSQQKNIWLGIAAYLELKFSNEIENSEAT
jgi:hypothetical protein